MNKHPDNRGAERIRGLFPGRGGQKQVSEETGYTSGAVSRWFDGLRKPDTKQRATLEDRYGIGWRLWDIEFERGKSSSVST